jgi:hypothetical protein
MIVDIRFDGFLEKMHTMHMAIQYRNTYTRDVARRTYCTRLQITRESSGVVTAHRHTGQLRTKSYDALIQ